MANIFRKLLGKKTDKVKNDTKAEFKQLKLSENLQDNLSRLNTIMSNSGDIQIREFNLAGSSMKAAVIYIESLSDDDIIQQHILKGLVMDSAVLFNKAQVSFQDIKNSMMSAGSVEEAETFDQIVPEIMSGNTLLTIQGFTKGLVIHTKGYQGRTIGEPSIEPSVKGPQEAFVEILKLNIGLVRRRVRDPNLCIHTSKIGRRAKADYAMIYIKGIIDEELVKETKDRIELLDLDGQATALEVGRMIQDRPNSIIPLIQATERPDKVVSAISEGRAAFLMDGAPEAIIIPATLPMLMQSADDYFESWICASIIRLSRYIAFFISALLPALYIAVTSFHPGMLPTNLILSIVQTRAGVPFPAIVEAILMEFTLELLQEAGIRLPKVVGQTVSIVGGLVIGQAAVQAGIVSPIMVIVIAISALSSFAIPNYSLGLATRIVRVPFMLLASTFGAFGIAMGLLVSLTYLASLKSFGVSYLKPISTAHPSDWQDSIIRAPLWMFRKRPQMLHPRDTIRLDTSKRREADED